METIKTRMDKAEEQISDIEDKIMEINEAEEGKKGNGPFRELSNLLKRNNICILRIPEVL